MKKVSFTLISAAVAFILIMPAISLAAGGIDLTQADGATSAVRSSLNKGKQSL